MALRPGPNSLQIGEWIADPGDDSLTQGPERQRIDPRAMQLLLRLARSPGEVVSQNVLLDDVWKGVVVSPSSVYQTISQLRKALGDTESPPSYIETVSRKGYRLVARVQPATAPPETAAEAPPETSVKPPAPRPRRARWLVAGLAVLAIGGGSFAWFTREVPPDSIVVLPFEDLTPNNTEQMFCDGMTEELTNWLVQIPGLRVVGGASAQRLKGKDLDVREIGRELGVTRVLKGSLRRSGNMLRISVQLIDTQTGYSTWSRPYPVLVDDLLKTQESIAREIAANMQLRLTLETDRRFAQRRSDSPAANRAYVLAQTHRRRATLADNQQAIALYRQALDIDPSFAMAKIGLAGAYIDQQPFEERTLDEIATDVEPLFADLEKSATNVADFYLVRGLWRNDQGKREAALQDVQRALALNPDSARASAALGYLYETQAMPRAALQPLSTAVALDPFASTSIALSCMALTDLGRFEEALEVCEQARSIEPDSQAALTAMSGLEEARGNAAAALKWTTIALQGSNGVAELHADRGRWLMRLGLMKEAHDAYESAVAATGDAALKNLGLAGLGLRSTFAVEGTEGVRRFIAANRMDETDDPEMMFWLAEAAQLTGDTDVARGYVQRALASRTMTPEKLNGAWNARNGRSYLVLAAATELASGDQKLAAQHLSAAQAVVERLVNDGMRRHDVYLLRAEIAALRGQPDAAMQSLTTAADLGWRYVWLAKHLPYFQSIRERADFKALMARIETRNAVDGAAILALLNPQPPR